MTARWGSPPPRDRWDDDPARVPRAFARALGISVVLWTLLALAVGQCHAQEVEPVVTLRDGRATTIVRNPAREPLTFTVELRGPLPALDSVRALVAPATFTLQPGETQTIHIHVRETIAPGTTLRLRTCYVPVAPIVTAALAPVAMLVLRTCILAKLQ